MTQPPEFSLSDIWNDTRRAVSNLGEYVTGLARPTVRLGVTGLSRAGKTVFITALVQALVSGGRLPVFRAGAEGRIRRAYLEPQPDDTVPRFTYEDHLVALTGGERHWPESTRRISELRLVIEYERDGGWFSPNQSTLTVDIVDYPGEWLLDLSLLHKSYAVWAKETITASRIVPRKAYSSEFLAAVSSVDPTVSADEMQVRQLSDSFTQYLRACRDEKVSLSALPPGRFLMPGDLEGSPALTFAPLDLREDESIEPGSIAAMMERRYEAYKSHVVKPFFRDHFSRLDRQIVLVDALSALNAGPEAIRDLENALADVLAAFKVGQNSVLNALFSPRIEKVIFAATKADHLHHTSHDRLEGIVRLLVGRAAAKVEVSGAQMDVIALASVRATREMSAARGKQSVPCIAGIPLAGEQLGNEVFDGKAEAAVFPGELPADPASIFADGNQGKFRALRFRPPVPERSADGKLRMLPSIRLDRALEFLIGDRLR